MVVTNAAAQFVTFRLGSDLTGEIIEAIGIGSGSGTALATQSTLLNEHTRVIQTGSPNFSLARKVTFQGDFNSVTMSGLILSEFGLFKSGIAGVGSAYQREAFGSIIFDGTSELQVVSTLEVIPR